LVSRAQFCHGCSSIAPEVAKSRIASSPLSVLAVIALPPPKLASLTDQKKVDCLTL